VQDSPNIGRAAYFHDVADRLRAIAAPLLNLRRKAQLLVGTVRSRLSRGRNALQQLMGTENDLPAAAALGAPADRLARRRRPATAGFQF
jgi:hypothetical protein